MRPGGRTLVGLIALLAGPALAGEYRAPRNADDQPDLEGQWTNGYLTQLERPDDFKTLTLPEGEARAFEKAHIGQPPEIKDDKIGAAASEWWELDVGLARIRGLPRTSWIVSPADGQVPFNQAAGERRKARHESRKTNFDNPETRELGERCLDTASSGPPMVNFGYNDNYQIVQTKEAVAIFSEYDHNMRVVRLGGAHPASGYRRWMGDSIGRYDGDTLVIETTNFTPTELESEDAGADIKVVERLRRISPSQLYYEFSVEGPALFEQPWRGEMLFFPMKGAIFEFACHEGNYSLANILAGGRELDKASASKAR